MLNSDEPRASSAFVVIAEFVVKPGCMDAFLMHAFDDARHSLAQEPGCLQFDVVYVPEILNGVLFYEVYRSRQAFDDHLATVHVERFRSILADHVETERPVRMLERLSLPSV